MGAKRKFYALFFMEILPVFAWIRILILLLFVLQRFIRSRWSLHGMNMNMKERIWLPYMIRVQWLHCGTMACSNTSAYPAWGNKSLCCNIFSMHGILPTKCSRFEVNPSLWQLRISTSWSIYRGVVPLSHYQDPPMGWIREGLYSPAL